MNPSVNNNSDKNLQGNLQAVGGLLLTGAGLSMSIDAGTVRAKGGKWFWYGTAALVVFQAGLCLVAGSVRYDGKNKAAFCAALFYVINNCLFILSASCY